MQPPLLSGVQLNVIPPQAAEKVTKNFVANAYTHYHRIGCRCVMPISFLFFYISASIHPPHRRVRSLFSRAFWIPDLNHRREWLLSVRSLSARATSIITISHRETRSMSCSLKSFPLGTAKKYWMGTRCCLLHALSHAHDIEKSSPVGDTMPGLEEGSPNQSPGCEMLASPHAHRSCHCIPSMRHHPRPLADPQYHP